MKRDNWIEVGRNNHCTFCDGASWCSYSSDRNFAICRRYSGGDGILKIDKSGAEYHVFYTGITPSGRRPTFPKYRRIPQVENLPGLSALDVEERSLIYSSLLDTLTLEEKHKKQLSDRGLSDIEISRRHYRSLPGGNRAGIVNKILEKFDPLLVARVPGFYINEKGFLRLGGPSGTLIPVRNSLGQIVAIKIRRDLESCKINANKRKLPKYLWLSSIKKGGAGPGAPIHIPMRNGDSDLKKIRITEGELKADIATALSDTFTISIPGASIWRSIIPILEELKVKSVIISLDADASTNRNVAMSLQKMARAIKAVGYSVKIETWNGSLAKGIDDALLAKADLKISAGIETFRTIEKITESAILLNPSRAELKMQDAKEIVSESVKLLKEDVGIIFQPDVLAALLIVKSSDSGEWSRARTAIKKAGIGIKELNAAMEREKLLQAREHQAVQRATSNNDGGIYSTESLADDSDVTTSQKYEVEDNCIFLNRGARETATKVQLSNFLAKIEGEETLDDGVEERKTFLISGTLESGRQLPKISVLAEEFNAMTWVTEQWGARAVISAGVGSRDHIRAAIQLLSENIAQQVCYGHTGWRKIDNDWVYFFNGGAIGKNGYVDGFNVDLGNTKLKLFVFPQMASADNKENVRRSLDFLKVGPPRITYPLFAAIFRAVLGEAIPVDFSIFLYGTTGLGKSEIAAMVQAHFGAEFHGKNLPGNWSSTANALELQSSMVKDAIFTVDDLAPQPTLNETNALLQKVERLLRAQGNQSGRGRLDSNIKQRAERSPRGLIVSTGEHLPMGASLRGRMLILELVNGDINFQILSNLQNSAREGVFAQVTASFIQYVASRMGTLKVDLVKRHQALRQILSAGGGHKRSPDMIASLTLGIEIFLQFALEINAITEAEYHQHKIEFQNALKEIVDSNKEHQLSEDPANRFIQLIGAALSGGRAHLVDADTGHTPVSPEQCGWQMKSPLYVDERDGRVTEAVYQARGDKIGWQPSYSNQLYLEPETAYAVAQKLSADQKIHFSTPQNTLWKILAEKGYLILSENEKRLKIKKTVNSQRKYVLCFKSRDGFFGDVSFDSKDSGILVQVPDESDVKVISENIEAKSDLSQMGEEKTGFGGEVGNGS